MALLNVPPESIWPTGSTPPELAAAMHAEGLKTPEDIRREQLPAPVRAPLAEVTGIYSPPPRPAPDLAALDQERLLHQVGMQPTVQRPLPVPASHLPVVLSPPSLTYSLPLGHGKRAEVQLYGPIGPPDIKLLLRHIRLMQQIEPPPPVASRPPVEERITRFAYDPNGTLSPPVNGKKPRKPA